MPKGKIVAPRKSTPAKAKPVAVRPVAKAGDVAKGFKKMGSAK